MQELQHLKRQAEILKREVDGLKAAKERNEARERDLMTHLQDYGEYIKMVSLVKAETEKKVIPLTLTLCLTVISAANGAGRKASKL